MTKVKEIWKDIEDYEGRYQVSNLGRIKSFYRGIRILKPALVGAYLSFAVCKNGRSLTLRVHRTVGFAFLPKSDKPEINHINAIKTDNRSENLEWCTRKENATHAVNRKLYQFGIGHHKSKLNDSDVIEIRASNDTMADIARRFKMSRNAVRKAKTGKTWKHLNNKN